MPSVRELRLVVTAADYDEALRFYRDVLGLTPLGAFSSPGGRVEILGAGRATVELADPPHAAYVDEVEVGHRAAGHIRVAFQVDDAVGSTASLAAAGATVVAEPTRTPWNSLNSRLDSPAGLHLTLFQELATGEGSTVDSVDPVDSVDSVDSAGSVDTAWLEELASGGPAPGGVAAAPGGGAAAAMNVAIGAALVAKVCHLTISKPRSTAVEESIRGALAEATSLRAEAVRLATEDEAAFGAVAAEVPLRTALAAAAVIGLARRILDGANVNVISDVAGAAASASAGLQAATVNVEVNLAVMKDAARRDELAARLLSTAGAAAEADSVVHEIRRRITA